MIVRHHRVILWQRRTSISRLLRKYAFDLLGMKEFRHVSRVRFDAGVAGGERGRREGHRALTFFDVLLLSFDVKKFGNIVSGSFNALFHVKHHTCASSCTHNGSETVVELEVAPPEPLVLPLCEPPLQLRREVLLPVAGLPPPHERPVHLVLPLPLQLLVQVLKMKRTIISLTVTLGTRFVK